MDFQVVAKDVTVLPHPGYQILATTSWLPDPGYQILAIWSYLELSRAIWSHLELSGGIWSYAEPSGATWSYLELSEAIWSYLEPSAAIWSYLELPGATWSYLELSETIWSYLELPVAPRISEIWSRGRTFAPCLVASVRKVTVLSHPGYQILATRSWQQRFAYNLNKGSCLGSRAGVIYDISKERLAKVRCSRALFPTSP